MQVDARTRNLEEQLARAVDELQQQWRIDSHQHVHRSAPVRPIMLRVAADLGVPLPECSSQIRYDGRFYGQASHGAAWLEGVGVSGLLGILSGLPAGISELGYHPGLDLQLHSTYCHERNLEAHTLCDVRVKEALARNGIELLSFRDVPTVMTADSNLV